MYYRRSGVGAWSRACVAAGLLCAAEAAARPALRVRGGCELQLTARRAADPHGPVRISGVLLDDLGEAIGGARVTLTWEGETTETVTDPEGDYGATATAAAGVSSVAARWEGDALHSGCHAEARVERGRIPVVLSWGLPPGAIVDLSEPRHEFEILASAEHGAAGLRLALSLDGGEPLAQARTDSLGRARVSVGVDALGAPRVARLEARTPGDVTRMGARAAISVTLRGRPTLQFDATAADGGQAAELTGHLLLADEALAGRAVTISDGTGQTLGTLPTDALGGFAGKLPVPPAHRGPDGSTELVARFLSDAPWLHDASAGPVVVALATPRAPSLLWLLLPLALSLWLLRRARLRPAPQTAGRGAQAAAQQQRRPGVVLGSTSTRRPSAINGIDGQVFDIDTGDALSGVRVALVATGTPPQAVDSDAAGHFAFATPPPGTLTLEASAEGYAAQAAEVRSPHRGQYREMQVGLRSLRNVAFEHFRAVGDRLGGRAGASSQQTPRELQSAAAARGALPSGAAELASRVEAAVYGAPAPTVDEVDTIGAEAARVDPLGGAETSAPEDGGGRRATIPHRR